MSLAFAAPSALTSLTESPRPARPVRVGVIGLGKMGVAHTAVLSAIPDCEVVGFADRHAGLGRSVRGMGHRAPFFRDAERLIEKTRPDAVFICTQPDVHVPLARLALAAGCAAFVEKPLSHRLADAEALAALSAERRIPVACGYTLGFVPIFAAAHHAVATGALGTVREARSSMYLSQTFGPRRGWMYEPDRSGGGVVANVSSHLLFLLQWFLGTPVTARATANRFYGEVEDELHGVMRLADGAEVGFDSSWSVPGYPYSAVVIELTGDNGKLLVSNDALETELLAPHGALPAGPMRLREADLPQPARFDVNGEGYYLGDASFLAWVTGGPEPPTAIHRALEVQRMMEALYVSAREGGRDVPVPR